MTISGIIITTICFLGVVFIWLVRDSLNDRTSTVLGFALIVTSFAAMFLLGTEYGYKRGNIDALTGKSNYHLIYQPDSSRVWEKIKP